jgi:hypothetical protein
MQFFEIACFAGFGGMVPKSGSRISEKIRSSKKPAVRVLNA